MTPEKRFILTLLLGLSAFLPTYLGGEIALKRKVFPWYLGLSSACFVGFLAALGFSGYLGILAPVVGLIALLNLRQTRYCNACDRAHVPSRRFTPTVCSQCGGALHHASGKKAQ